MKRLLFFSLSLMLALATSTQAQTLIDEGFEDVPGTSATETLPGGWERVNTYSGATVGYRWTIGYTANGGTMSGHRYAYCNAPTYIAAGRDGVGPRKEVLLTPAVELDNTYQLSFDWEAAAASVAGTSRTASRCPAHRTSNSWPCTPLDSCRSSASWRRACIRVRISR